MIIFLILLSFFSVAYAQIEPPVPHLLGLCQPADSATSACVGEDVTCIARVINDTPDTWLLKGGVINGNVVGGPLLMGPGTSFDMTTVVMAVETVPGFLEVSAAMTLDRADGFLLDYNAALRPSEKVIPCTTSALRVRRRARRALSYRARCHNETLTAPLSGKVRVCCSQDSCFTAVLP